jgi:hypothetical protein
MRYRPGGPPGDPVLRKIWEQGYAQLQGGPSCPTPEQMQPLGRVGSREREAYWAGMRANAGKPTAPIRWPIETALLAIEAAIQSVSSGMSRATICAIPLSLSIGKLRTELGERRASELGLTAETAPQLRIGWEWAVLALARYTCLRLRGTKPVAPTWTFAFAQSLIREILRRQAWRRALHTSS